MIEERKQMRESVKQIDLQEIKNVDEILAKRCDNAPNKKKDKKKTEQVIDDDYRPSSDRQGW